MFIERKCLAQETSRGANQLERADLQLNLCPTVRVGDYPRSIPARCLGGKQ
jgi:hypothetical protein